jgi:HK97 family phage major capsid protein
MNLKEQLKNKALVMKAMVDKAKAENRSFTEDEETLYASHESELNAIQAKIDEEEKIQNRQKNLDNILSASTGTVAARNDDPQVKVVKDAADKPWQSFGEQLQAVKNHARNAGTDPRLTVKNAASGSNEAIDSEGGFLVGTDFATELMKRTYDTGVLLNQAQRIPISSHSNSLTINGIDETSRKNGSRWGGVQTYWADEADALTGSKPKFRKIKLELKKLIGLCYATDELLQDGAALESVIMQAFSEEFGFQLDDAMLRGDGAGKPLGILKSDALVTIGKESGQAAKTVLYQNVLNMWTRLYAKSRQNAVWYINQDIEAQLYTMYQATGTTGVPVFMPARGDSTYSTLFGRPIIPIEQADTLGNVGDIVLADFSQYAMIDKGGMQSASSIHVRFLNDEQVFRFTLRTDGQPKWNAPLVPYKGTNAQSPFITLAAR